MAEPVNERVVEVPDIPGLKLIGPRELPLEQYAAWLAYQRARLTNVVHHPSQTASMPTAPREVWTPAAVAQHLKLTKPTIHRMCESGELAGAFRRGPGGHWRIPVEAIEQFLAATRPLRRRAR